MSRRHEVVIIGAGPTGLGAAYRLQELGHRDFVLLEAQPRPGGLAASSVDSQGFTWDIGGHVQFSHYWYYDRALDEALGDQWLHHQRESWVWMKQRFIPYPFQNNIHRLDDEDQKAVLAGLSAAKERSRDEAGQADNFLDWILRTFGSGLAELFMVPYNLKVWGYPLQQMSADWVGERVAAPDLERLRRNIRENRDDVSWGPNRTFRFPLHGGTGAIWRGVAELIEPGRISYGQPVRRVDLSKKRILLGEDREVEFRFLINTMPLDTFCGLTEDLPQDLQTAASSLVYSSTHVIGIGLQGPQPESLGKKCWMYFPESESPYYRVTVFSNYSPHNVPDISRHWSLMAEVCETPFKPVQVETLREQTLSAMRRDELIGDECRVVSFWHHREQHGYPTPFRGRDSILQSINSFLESKSVLSRGRFGAWKYEVSNQDHSFMQGVEAVDRILGLGGEPTLNSPNLANSGVFLSKS